MKFLTLLATLACLRLAAISIPDFNGVWILAEAEMAGNPLNDDQLGSIELTLKDGKYSVTIGDSTARGTFKIDDSTKPAQMDLHEDEGQNAGRDIKAIYERAGSGWRFCYDLAGGPRPTSLTSTADNGWFLAQYKRKPGTEPAAASPLKVLLISGGCCHDYPGQDKILSNGLKARGNFEVTVVRDEGKTGVEHKISVYHKENWAAGYDLVVHNECFSDEKSTEWLERIVKPHRDGVPAVVIHCAMHCYRAPSTEWFQFIGVTSRRHGSHFAYPMTNVKPEHPIMKGFPAVWLTPKDELYNIESVEKTATPLATGYSHETKRGEANVWINTYGKARVFGTTLGHYNETMSAQPILDMLGRGALWSCGKLGDDGQPLPGYGPR